MAKKKLGIGSIEVNKKFKDSDEAFRYAKRLNSYIRYICKKNADKGWLAQSMIVVSNMKKDVSRLKYENSGKRGRPRKRLEIDENIAYKWYKGDYMTDYHLHILLVSKPGEALERAIKKYIDKNWIVKSNIQNKQPFNANKKKVYKTECNIKITDYFIAQCEKVLFCDCNFGEEEKLKYSLRNYYSEYLKVDSKYRKYCVKLVKEWIPEKEQLKELEKIYNKFETIEKYYLDITKEQDNKSAKQYMNMVKLDKIKDNYNKEQNIHHKRIYDNAL